jgi:hypothetical protein
MTVCRSVMYGFPPESQSEHFNPPTYIHILHKNAGRVVGYPRTPHERGFCDMIGRVAGYMHTAWKCILASTYSLQINSLVWLRCFYSSPLHIPQFKLSLLCFLWRKLLLQTTSLSTKRTHPKNSKFSQTDTMKLGHATPALLVLVPLLLVPPLFISSQLLYSSKNHPTQQPLLLTEPRADPTHSQQNSSSFYPLLPPAIPLSVKSPC